MEYWEQKRLRDKFNEKKLEDLRNLRIIKDICQNEDFTRLVVNNKLWNKMLINLEKKEVENIIFNWIIASKKYNVKSELVYLLKEFIKASKVMH